MGRTFKKASAGIDDEEQQTHFYKFRKSRETRGHDKNIDKYLKQRNFDKLDDEYEYEYDYGDHTERIR
ncbi:MAG: hypothetical protein EBS98_09580 [Chitinophagia bacterium]|jgi:hypothetical protein|nr:hypothetical protein [Chitinophagia bacterium]